MTKSPWIRRLAFAFEPIDWAALAVDRKWRTRKGDKRALWEVEKMLASRRAGQERRRREAKLRALERDRERRRSAQAKRQSGLAERIMLAMEPGGWYARPDLRNLTGLKRNSLKAKLPDLEKAGFLERAKNPEWTPKVYEKGVRIDMVPEKEPEWLWRLTDKGVARRAELAKVAGCSPSPAASYLL